MLGSSTSDRGSTPPLHCSGARRRSQPLSRAPYLHRDWIAALALPRWPLPSVSFPARFTAIFATALGLRPSDMQPFSVSMARYGTLRLTAAHSRPAPPTATYPPPPLSPS